MDTRRYAGVSEEYFSKYVEKYQALCSHSWRIYIPLFVGGIAQGIVYTSWFEALVARPLVPVSLVAGLSPIAIYFVITFCRIPPPLTPRNFRRLLFVVMAWYVANTLVVFVMAPWSPQVAPGAGIATTVIRVCMVFGCLAIPALLLHHNALRRQELKAATVSGCERGA